MDSSLGGRLAGLTDTEPDAIHEIVISLGQVTEMLQVLARHFQQET